MTLVEEFHRAHVERKKRLWARSKEITSKPKPKIIFIVDGKQVLLVENPPEPPKRDFLFLATPTDNIKVPEMRTVQRVVARQFGVNIVELLSQRRTRDIAFPRQVAMYLCKHLTFRSLPEIGRYFGGKDHTTVLHGVRKIEAMRQCDPALDETIKTLEAKLRGEG